MTVHTVMLVKENIVPNVMTVIPAMKVKTVRIVLIVMAVKDMNVRNVPNVNLVAFHQAIEEDIA
ncbi:hypothetical protein [Lyngbya sp. CCY1209]|uniref:hypothetical protein n=1 Tax=Lyngbya sp. CCY1209 TaxID=2886103 RepID=UPI002D1FDC48|nr:hypothetical protein [Lyngbya sp. CCY1209]MEB3882100.1 hypothetical protein [Lyngbya sp. CCY1209]